ncbi:hypothetical protein QR680_012157 [Steinernema hermaphroditum]|uniref:TOG domain-containing protein n=1 Tax=Steinernema hermaphroditum TaxID=289476 RepID=A0AA39I3T3_9BILA|nr:hypothetical protein QR680_012157 [Steinernema hermaphroditum]
MFAFAAFLSSPPHHFPSSATTFAEMSWLAELVARNSPDPRVRLELGAEIVNIVSETRLPNDSKILNDFCDLIVQWMSASNFKVSLLATQIASRSIDVSGDLISPYIVDRLRHFVERLGDSKANVRDATVDLLNDLSQTNNASPQVVLEKLIGELGHRQYMVKIGAMQVIKDIIDENRQLVEAQTKKLIPSLCKLMADANSDVREMAAGTLVTCCVNYGGDNVCHQIAANQRLPSAKLQLIKDRYRRAQNSAPVTYVSNHINQIPSTSRHSLPPTTPRRPMARASYNKSLMTFRASSVPAKNAAGAVSEDQFRQAFNDVPRKAIYDGRELASAVETVRTTLENPNIDWDRRVKALKELRGVINGGALDFPEFEDLFRSLETGIVTSIKDLRSQVCREGCITLAFLCEKLDKCTIARLTETTMPILILLMQNSAKVMATSGILASSYVVRHSRNPKIVQLVIDGQKHKSKEIRRSCIRLINDILANWEPKVTERIIGSIVEAIRAGLCDADAEARQKARVAYGELEAKFNKQAMFLYQSLDPSKQKMLHGQVSQSSSTHSVASERDIAQKRAANYHALRSTSDINIGSARRVQQTPSRYAKPTPAAVSAVRPQRTTASSVSAARPPIGTQRKVLSAPTPQPTSKSVSQPGSRSTSPKRTTTSKPRLVTGATNGSPNRMYAPLKHNGRSLSGTNRAEMERALQAYTGPSTSMFNIRDHQTKLITDICSILHSRDESPDDKLQALGMLSQMTRDGSFTLWEDHFGQIIVVIMQVLKNSSGELKKAALRTVKDICSSQASRFNSVAEMTISGVLKAFNDPEAAVTRMAEDCGSTLATHLNVQVCLRVLLPVVNSGSADPSAVSGAIKMIGKLLESVTPEQVMSMLPTVAPGIVEAYNSDNSSIRRASVLVLVGIYNIVGDKIMPYMQELNKTKLTLFEVYIKKTVQRHHFLVSPPPLNGLIKRRNVSSTNICPRRRGLLTMLSEDIPVQQQPSGPKVPQVMYDTPRTVSTGYGVPRDTVNPHVLSRPSRPSTTTTASAAGSVASSPSAVRQMPSHQPLLTRQSTSTPVQTPTIILHSPPEDARDDEPCTFEHFKFKPNGGGSKVIHEGTDVEAGGDAADDWFSRNRWRMVTFVAIVFIVTGAVLIYMILSQVM